MTVKELKALVEAKKAAIAEEAAFQTKENDTVKNIETKVVPNGTEIDDKKETNPTITSKAEDTPNADDVKKVVAKDEGPLVDADKDGVSKNGGEKPLTDDSIEKAKAKQDSEFKDVINVSERTQSESADASAELLQSLKLAEEQIAGYKAKITSMNESIKKIVESKTEFHNEVLTNVLREGYAFEQSMNKDLSEAKANSVKFEEFSKKALFVCGKAVAALKESRAPKAYTMHESKIYRLSK